MRIIRTLLLILLIAPQTTFAAPPNDFDGDSVSDLIGVTPEDSGSLSWQVRLSSTGETSQLSAFGEMGNHLVPGRWRGATSERAIVEPGDDGLVKLTLEDQSSKSVDAVGGTLISGGDFDGNGILDVAVTKKAGGKLSWKIYLNLFGDSPSESESFNFGSANDKPFFISTDGTTDLLAVFNTKKGLISYRSMSGGTVSRVRVPSGTSFSDSPIRIRTGDADMIAFTRVTGKRTNFSIFRLNGGRVGVFKVAGDGVFLVGDFDSTSVGEEVGVHDGEQVRVINPLNKKRTIVPFISQIAADEININQITSNFSTSPTPEPGQCVELSPNDGSKIGFVWKPNSDTTYYAVAVLPGTFYGNVDKVTVLDSNSSLIKALQFTGCGNPDSTGVRCNYKDFALTGADYARMYGSIIVKVTKNDGGCNTYRITNPAKRTD